MTDEQYVQYLENFKRIETRKRYYQETMGMNAKLAEATVNAEISGNQDLLKKCFQAFRENGSDAKAPGAEPNKEQAETDAFLKGFNKTLW